MGEDTVQCSTVVVARPAWAHTAQMSPCVDVARLATARVPESCAWSAAVARCASSLLRHLHRRMLVRRVVGSTSLLMHVTATRADASKASTRGVWYLYYSGALALQSTRTLAVTLVPRTCSEESGIQLARRYTEPLLARSEQLRAVGTDVGSSGTTSVGMRTAVTPLPIARHFVNPRVLCHVQDPVLFGATVRDLHCELYCTRPPHDVGVWLPAQRLVLLYGRRGDATVHTGGCKDAWLGTTQHGWASSAAVDAVIRLCSAVAHASPCRGPCRRASASLVYNRWCSLRSGVVSAPRQPTGGRHAPETNSRVRSETCSRAVGCVLFRTLTAVAHDTVPRPCRQEVKPCVLQQYIAGASTVPRRTPGRTVARVLQQGGYAAAVPYVTLARMRVWCH